MAKTEITEKLEKAISVATNKIGVFSCFEVTIGFGGNERVDYLTLDTKNIWRCYEVKASVADFRSKAKKSFVGHYNYFVMTRELFESVKNEIPKHIGVYVYGTCVKRAQKQDLLIEDDILKLSLIRSLSRDATKLYQSENPRVIENFKRNISRLENERNQYRNQVRELIAAGSEQLGNRWHLNV